jgi:hypothetical protein
MTDPAVTPFEPVIIGFTCNWCSYRAADLAGTSRLKYPPNVRLIRVMCSGRVDPTFVLKAIRANAIIWSRTSKPFGGIDCCKRPWPSSASNPSEYA